VQPRKHIRYRLNAPVSFIWRDEREVQHEGTGETRDVALGGVFVFARTCPPLEAPVHVELLLPKLTSEARPLLVQGDGQVIRVEPGGPNGTGGGFAASINRFLLHNGQGALTEEGVLIPGGSEY
jgi:hypothetical protein